MNEILKFLVSHMSFLWSDGRYTIERSMGGSIIFAELHVVSRDLRMSLICDRGQLLLQFQPSALDNDSDWFGVEYVYQLLKRNPERRGSLLDPEFSLFVEDNLPEIEQRFSPDFWAQTRLRLRGITEADDQRRFPGRPM